MSDELKEDFPIYQREFIEKLSRKVVERNKKDSHSTIEDIKNEIKLKTSDVEKSESYTSEMLSRISSIKEKIKTSSEKISDLEKNIMEKEENYFILKEKSEDVDFETQVQRTMIENINFFNSKLISFNIFETSFSFDFSKAVAMVNGYRIGNLSLIYLEFIQGRTYQIPVSTQEINNGFGNVMHMICCIVHKSNFHFGNIIPIYSGSHSYFKHIEGTQEYYYNLHCYNMYKVFWTTKFDRALIFLLQIISSIFSSVKSKMANGRHLCLPRAISGQSICFQSTNDGTNTQRYKITYNSNTNENWTMALKYALEDLKYISELVFNY